MTDRADPTTASAPAPSTEGRGTPPKSARRRRILSGAALLTVAGLAAFAVYYVPAAGLSSSDVTTGQHPGYPQLKPRQYDVAPETAVQFAAAAASRLSRWKVVRTDVQGLTMHAEVRTAIPLFTDDITVTIVPHPNGVSEVVIRSKSRVGSGDLGENARHIRALQEAMDQRLPLAD